jgi:hypothetical protein
VDLLVLYLNRREKYIKRCYIFSKFRNRIENIYRNMWYIIFKFRKYLNCETLEMFKYMHGTLYFLMLWKIFELKKIFRNRRKKIYRNRREKIYAWYNIF